MYKYNSETKTLTLNEWGDIRFLPYDIKRKQNILFQMMRPSPLHWPVIRTAERQPYLIS